MTADNIHRLLKRQIKKHKIPSHLIEEHLAFFKDLDKAYRSSDQDLSHLENVLEINSQELFKANLLLKEDNVVKTNQTKLLKTKLDRVMDNVTDIIFELDANGNFTYLNSAWIKYSGLSPEQCLGHYFMDYAGNITMFDSELLQKIQQRDFSDLKTVFRRHDKDGHKEWWEVSVKLLFDQYGEVDGAIGSLLDVTTLKLAEEELKKASDAKSAFLSTMSHEIRTPLNAVIAISNILLMQDPKPEQLDNLNALKFSSRHLLSLVNDILDYNKMTTGNLKFENEPFSLQQLLDGILKTYEYTSKDKNVMLHSNVDSDLPQTVKGDSTRLSQVLNNLLGNAFKFTNQGQVHLSVTKIESKAKSDVLRFVVSDTGIGIAQDKLKYIFERFTQAENHTSKKFGGTGLGLAISKKIINLQGSEIFVESELGAGTTFTFDLEFDHNEEELVVSEDLNDSQFDLRGIKVLIVDDNAMNVMVLSQFLDKWNVIYEEANDGQEAIDLIKTNEYDVVLMDLRMPVKDGYTAVKELRSFGGRYSELPIIALSASVSNEVIEKVTDVGMNDYLCKPFDPVDLYRKLHRNASVSLRSPVVK